MSQIRVLFKDSQIKLIPITEDEMVIGSADDCAIYIDSLAIQPYHALLLKEGKQVSVRCLHADYPMRINDQEIKEARLKDGDRINIGKHVFQFESDIIQNNSQQDDTTVNNIFQTEKKTHEAWLQILSGANLGKTINLHRQLTHIGKAGVQLEVIAKRNDGYFLSHLEGKELPAVNGQKIGDSSLKLEDGDTISIGKIKLQFTIV